MEGLGTACSLARGTSQFRREEKGARPLAPSHAAIAVMLSSSPENGRVRLPLRARQLFISSKREVRPTACPVARGEFRCCRRRRRSADTTASSTQSYFLSFCILWCCDGVLSSCETRGSRSLQLRRHCSPAKWKKARLGGLCATLCTPRGLPIHKNWTNTKLTLMPVFGFLREGLRCSRFLASLHTK